MNTGRTRVMTLKQAVESILGYNITDSQYYRSLEIARQELKTAGHKMPMPGPGRIARIQAEIKTVSQEPL